MKRCTCVVASLLILASTFSRAQAAIQYWDGNGATGGAGATPNGTWGTSTFWSTDSTGASATAAWTSGNDAVFAAGTDATGAYTVTIAAATIQTANSVLVEEGTVTLSTGGVATNSVQTQTITVNNNASLFVNKAFAFTVPVAGGTCTLNGPNATMGNSNTGNGGSFFGSSTANTNMGIVLNGGGHLSAKGGAGIVTIYTGLISGSGPLVIDGTGVFRLTTTAATYSGATTINGTLQISTTANVIPNGTDMTINAGGKFDIQNDETIGSLSGAGNVVFTGAHTLTISGSTSPAALTGNITQGTSNSSITRSGTGTLTLGGINTYNGTFTNTSGTTTVNLGGQLCGPICDVVVTAGTLNLNNAAQIIENLSGAGGTINLNNASLSLTTDPVASTTYSGIIAGVGGLTKLNASATTRTLALAGANTYDGATIVSAGKIQAASANALGSTVGNTQVASGAELLFDGAASNFTLAAEAIQIAGFGAGGGGAITAQNSAKVTVSGAVSMTADAALAAASGASVTYSNTVGGTDTSLTLLGAGGNGTISGAVSLGTGSLTKNDSGTWTLSNGAGNTYSGGTVINSGTLLANNTSGSATGSSTVTVNGGTLGGTGNTDATGGAVTVLSGGHIKAGAGAASGTLTVPTLNLQSGALLSATLGASTSAAKTAVTNTDGATVDGQLEIVTTNGFTGGNGFRILTYNGTRQGAGLQASTQAGFDSVTIHDTGTSGFIDIDVVVTDRTWADVTGSGNWSDNNNWGPSPPKTPPDGPGAIANFNTTSPNPAHAVTLDSARTVGIVNLNSATKYTLAGSTLTMDTWGADGQINVTTGAHEISVPLTLTKKTNISVASGQGLTLSGAVQNDGGLLNSGAGTTTITGAVANTGSLTHSGSGTMTVSGDVAGTGGVVNSGGGALNVSGIISGAQGVTNSGAGTTTLSGVNTYTGGNTVSAGTLAGTSTSIIGNIADNGSVIFNQTANGTYASLISGTGSVTKNGGGVLTISNTGVFSYSGGFNLNAGTVAVNSTTALGAASSPVNIANATTLSTSSTSNRTLTYAFAVNGDFTLGTATATNAITMAGTVNLGGATRIVSVGNGAETISGVISNGGLTVNANTGVLSVTGANTYSGNTTLSTGTTAISGSSTLGDNTGTVNTGTLNMAGGTLRTTATRNVTSAPVANPINMTADTLVETNSTAATVDLNFSSNTVSGSAGTLTLKNNGADGVNDTFQPRFTGNGFNFTRPIVIDNGAVGKTKLMSFNTTGTSHTFSGVISGNGVYNRSASSATTGGTSILTAGNIYSGGTTVNDGLLLVNNTVSTESGTGTGPVTVGSGPANPNRGTLGGSGFIGGAVTVQEGGAIAPGNSVGTITLNGGLTVQANSALNMELAAPGTSDLINVTLADGLTLNGGTVNLSNAGGLAAGTYTLIDYAGTLGGSVSNLALGTQPAGFTFALSNNLTNTSIDLTVGVAGVPGDFNGNNVLDAADYVVWSAHNGQAFQLTNEVSGTTPGQVTIEDYDAWRARFGNTSGSGSGSGLGGRGAVPEPTTFGLLLLGSIGFALRRRR